MRKKIIAIITVLTLLLTGCGGQIIEEQSEVTDAVSEQDVIEDEIRWRIKETILPNADEALAELVQEGAHSPMEFTCGMVGDTVYRVVRLYGEGLETKGVCIQKLEAPYATWENYPIYIEEWVEGSVCYVSEAVLGQDGSVYLLLHDWNGEANENYYMAKWTEEEGHTVSLIQNETIDENFDSNATLCYVDSDDISYFTHSSGIQYFDGNFSEGKEWVDTSYIYQLIEDASEEGKIYLCGSSVEGYFRVWCIESKKPVFSSDDVLMSWSGKVALVNETDGFLCTPEGIWEFSSMDDKCEESLSFSEQGYPVERICGATVREDSVLLMTAVIDEELVLLERVEDTRWQDMVQLELATTLATPFLREAIVEFNKMSDSSYITLRVPAEGEDFNDFKTRIQAEISGGGGPALFSDTLIDLNTAAEKGFVRNLTQDYAEKKDELLENVRALGEVDGEIYAIPYSFGVNALVTFSDVTGGKESWNFQEMKRCVETSDAEAVVSCYSGAELFNILTMYTGSGGFIDWENGKSNLNSEEAVSVLEFVQKYGDTGAWSDSGLRIVEGEVMATVESITSLDGPKRMEAMFQGKEVYIGFPVEDGKNGNVVWGETLSINQACEYPEEALAFIRYLLEAEMQDKHAQDACGNVLGSSGFPVRADALENMFLYAEAEQGHDSHEQKVAVNYGGYEFTPEALSKGSLEKLRVLLYHARPAADNTGGIFDIINEETPAYFSGEKSAQEVLDILQNRTQLYMDEMN